MVVVADIELETGKLSHSLVDVDVGGAAAGNGFPSNGDVLLNAGDSWWCLGGREGDSARDGRAGAPFSALEGRGGGGPPGELLFEPPIFSFISFVETLRTGDRKGSLGALGSTSGNI